MILLAVSILLLFASGVSKAIMDKVNFHFKHSIFNSLKFKQTFWNPKISWKNKWKNNDKSQGEKFLFSSTILVFTTDAWHLFQFFYRWCLCFGIVLMFIFFKEYAPTIISIPLSVITSLAIQSFVFEKFFSIFLEKKQA